QTPTGKFKRSRTGSATAGAPSQGWMVARRARLYRRTRANTTPARFGSEGIERAGIKPAETGIVLEQGPVDAIPTMPQEPRRSEPRHRDVVGDVDNRRRDGRCRFRAERRNDHLRRAMDAHAWSVDDLDLARSLGQGRRDHEAGKRQRHERRKILKH